MRRRRVRVAGAGRCAERRTEGCGQQKQSNNPHNIQHSPGTPTTGLRGRGTDTSGSTGRSGRQKAATRRNMRREERVTVQGPVKKQQPDGMSHRGVSLPMMRWKGGAPVQAGAGHSTPGLLWGCQSGESFDGPGAGGLRGNTARQVMDGLWTEARGRHKQSNDPGDNQHNPQYANYWAPLTRKRHTLPPPAQPRHTNHWTPRTRKRYQQQHRPQRPTERSDPTQHAKGRTGDCPGPRKETANRRNVTGVATAFTTASSLQPPSAIMCLTCGVQYLWFAFVCV